MLYMLALRQHDDMLRKACSVRRSIFWYRGCSTGLPVPLCNGNQSLLLTWHSTAKGQIGSGLDDVAAIRSWEPNGVNASFDLNASFSSCQSSPQDVWQCSGRQQGRA